MDTNALQAIVQAIGYPAAALGILIETLGIPFPGETMMLVVSAYAAQGHLDIRIVILTAFAGTIVGANLGYLIGYRGGRPLIERLMARLHLKPAYLVRTELFFIRYGAATILFARFIAGLRQWSAVLAGMARMPLLRFELYTLIGAAVWSTAVCLAGFLLGRNLPLLERVFATIGYVGVAVIVVAVAGVLLLRRFVWRPDI